MDIPSSLAWATINSRSSRNVRPASTANTVVPVSFMTEIDELGHVKCDRRNIRLGQNKKLTERVET